MTTPTTIIAESYFDGERFFEDGPYTITTLNGRIDSLERGAPPAGSIDHVHAPFLMPGLVEGHAHLFLNGAELDVKKRSDYLSAPREEMMAVARSSAQASMRSGVTLLRDAGDIHGINTAIKAELAGRGDAPAIRSAGRALRKVKRYGSFMAIEATDSESIVACIEELVPTADVVKVLMTGIIDFKSGKMMGSVQFDAAEAELIVTTARAHGLRTFTHCSGVDGLAIAVGAGMDSIEHGFFMTRKILEQMAEKQIAWVPTFSPVHFQFERPELAGWDAETVGRLEQILDNHYRHLAMAFEMGVPIVAGSDAGSYGVPHGVALIDELFHAAKAGIPLEAILASATSTPRARWGYPSADIKPGNYLDLIVLGGSPRVDMENLRRIRAVYRSCPTAGAHQASHRPAHIDDANPAPLYQ